GMAKRNRLPTVQSPVASRRVPRRRSFTLALDAVAPVIRIAHRITVPMKVGPRIIFDHELVLVRAGRAELRLGHRTYKAQPGAVLSIPPFVPHTIVSDDSPRHEHVAIHFDMAPGTPPHAQQPSRRKPYEVRLSHGVRIAPCTAVAPGH